MTPHILRSFLLSCTAALLAVFALRCNRTDAVGASAWKNVYDTSAHYVGMETCRSCHYEVYNTFIKTGMGQSFGQATREKSAADFTHAPVYDKGLDFWYKPFWKGDTLYFLEYRLEGADTIHRLEQRIDYIIGSGQHTNSHLFSSNGYIHQAPITFYTQRKKWDLAPGFENAASSRFSRLIESECMTCHNGLPEFVPTSQNKYLSVKHGIDCERCHGPGSLHVEEKGKGILVDTSEGPDYTIVNPRRLSTDLQNDVCSRCHLQGIAVLNDNKTFFDFRPGMQLREVMNVFMPQYEGHDDKMIMASHVERMKKSPCYLESGKMSCITCHNPHVSVKFTPKQQYITACNSCHGAKAEHGECTERADVRAARSNDCISCHMPSNGSIDIPHVAVTDHFIRKRPVNTAVVSEEERTKLAKFVGLRSFSSDKGKPSALIMAKAYLEFYERFVPQRVMIDSALYYLSKAKDDEEKRGNREFIRAYFLLNDFEKAASYASSLKPASVTDAWTAYRLAESFSQTGRTQEAAPWYQRAVSLMPHALDFQNKWGTCLLGLGRESEARQVFQYIISENPMHAAAHDNLGFCYLQKGEKVKAYTHFSRALALNPDREQTLLNLAVWHYGAGEKAKAALMLKRLLKKNPRHERARAMLTDLEDGI